MLLEEDYPYNTLVLILALLSRIDALEKLPSFTAVLPHEPSGIPNKELPTLIPKLAGSDIGIVAILVQLSEHLFQASSDMIIHSHVVGGEYEDVVAEGADPEVEDGVELVNLSGFLLEGGGSELGDLLLADQALGELRDYLEAGGVDEVLLAVYYLDRRERAEVPDAHAQLVVEGEDVREGAQEAGGDQIARVLLVLACEAFDQRDVERVYIDGGAEAVGEEVISELS